MRAASAISNLEKKTLQPLDNPIGTRLSPMSPVRSVTHVSGPGHIGETDCMAAHVGLEPPYPIGSDSAAVSEEISRLWLKWRLQRPFAFELRCGGYAAAARISVIRRDRLRAK